MLEILHFSLISALITLAAGLVMWYFSRYDFDYTEIYNEGIELYRRRQYKPAIAKFKLAIAKFPEQSQPYYNLGLCLLRTRSFSQAREAFLEAFKYNPRDVDTIYNLGYTEMCLQNYPKAKEYYNMILKAFPDDADVLFNLGYIEGEEKNFKAAQEYISQALNITPDKAGFKRYYVDVLDALFEQSGSPKIIDEMLNLCLELMIVLPNDENLVYKTAVVYARMGDWESSVNYCERMIEINPNSYKACSQYGLTLFCKGETKRAIEMYERSIKLAPDMPDSYLNLVFAYDKIGDVNKATKLVETFIRKFPDDPTVEMAKDYLERRAQEEEIISDADDLPKPISRKKNVDVVKDESVAEETLATEDSEENLLEGEIISEEENK